MIPKTIHYCWFGGSPKMPDVELCIESWRKYCPDYQIIEWNENNVDFSKMPLYAQQAYRCKKWAFLTDYIRLLMVYTYGGIYLDTDVELLRPLDPLLSHPAFFGIEETRIATGLGFGSEAGNVILLELMQDYENRCFLLPDGSMDMTPCPQINTEIFKRHGFISRNIYQEIPGLAVIYPTEYFCPLDYYSGEMTITSNTYSIHHYMASWQTKSQRRIDRKKRDAWKYGSLKEDYKAVKKQKGMIYALFWAIKEKFKRKGR